MSSGSYSSQITNMFKSENVDILFLTETDTRMLVIEDSYKNTDYKTILPLNKKDDDLVRIIFLVNEKIMKKVKIRTDLMDAEVPSIWIQDREDQNKCYQFLKYFMLK